MPITDKNSFAYKKLLSYNSKDIYYSGNPTFSLFAGKITNDDKENSNHFNDGCNVPLEGFNKNDRHTHFSSFVQEFRSEEDISHEFVLNKHNCGDVLTDISTGVPISQIKSAKIIINGFIYSAIDEHWIKIIENKPNKVHKIPFPCFEKNIIGMPVDPVKLVSLICDVYVKIETKIPVSYLDIYVNTVLLDTEERSRCFSISYETRLKMYKTITIPIPKDNSTVELDLSSICKGMISCLIWNYMKIGSKKKVKASSSVTFSLGGNKENRNCFFYTRIQKEFVGLNLDSSTYCKSFAVKPGAGVPTGEFNTSVAEARMTHDIKNEYTDGTYVINLMVMEWSVVRGMSGYLGHVDDGFFE
jgi:hypothetical protein